MNISLHIVYENGTGRPLTAAKTYNSALIREAAKVAIYEAFDKASLMTETDCFVGNIQREEAERLKRVLEIMIPGLEKSLIANGK